MFVRMVKTKSGKKIHCYLRVVESYRLNGRVRQRVLWNMGKWERVRPGLRGLVRSLGRFSGEQFLTAREIRHRQIREYGNILLLKHLWESSGFRKILESSLGTKVRHGKSAVGMTNCIMAMVFHRLCQPALNHFGSGPTIYAFGATALLSWLKRVYLPEAERLIKLGPQRLRERLLKSTMSLDWLGGPNGQKDPFAGRSCVIEIIPVSPIGKRYSRDYLATLSLRGNNLAWCGVYAKREYKKLLQKVRTGFKPNPAKRIIVVRHSTLGREGVTFMDKESIPYLAFLKGGRTPRRRSRKRYLAFKYGNQKVYLRTNIARTMTPYKARRAFKGLLETETVLSRPSLNPLIPPKRAYLKGYILVLILAYLLERKLREGLSRFATANLPKARQGIIRLKPAPYLIGMGPAEVLDTLKEVRIVSNLLAGKRWDYLIGITRERRALLKAFGIRCRGRALALSQEGQT